MATFNSRQAEFKNAIKLMRELFVLAAKERPSRPDMIEIGKDHIEPAWVLYERETMLWAVNDLRQASGFEPVSIDSIARAEQMAVGHVDYGTKFPLYCAEIALGIDSPNP